MQRWGQLDQQLLPSTAGYGWMATWSGDQVMKSKSPPWVWLALTLPACSEPCRRERAGERKKDMAANGLSDV